MEYQEIFELAYTQFRGQDIIPGTDDPEWTIFMRYANIAIMTWDRADRTQWQELFTTLQQEGETITLSAGTSQYELPSNVRNFGNSVRVADRLIPLIGSQDSLNVNASASVAYITGGANTGYFLNMNGYNGSYAGEAVDFTYYKKPTLMTGPTSVPEMSDPNYMVQKMVALRTSNERNGFVYQIADRDATIALSNMVLANANPSDLNYLNDGTPGFGESYQSKSIFG